MPSHQMIGPVESSGESLLQSTRPTSTSIASSNLDQQLRNTVAYRLWEQGTTADAAQRSRHLSAELPISHHARAPITMRCTVMHV
ncbi:MAG: hypothetical protein Q9199_005572 [Rusavskia elegans]